MKNTKRTRRVAAFAAAVMMAACVAVPMSSFSASAAATATITFVQADEKDTASHTYTAYKIFNGTIEEGSDELKDPSWALTTDQANALVAALKETGVEGFSSLKDSGELATSVASALSKVTDTDDLNKIAAAMATLATAESGWTAAAASSKNDDSSVTISISSTGYYLFVETSITIAEDQQGAYSKHILQTINVKEDDSDDTTITVKSGLPTVVKKVKENVKFTDDDGYGAGYNDVADWNISDNVPFELIGTLPERYSDYDHYYYCFNDTLDAGFVAPKESDINVYVVNGTTETKITDQLNEGAISVSSALTTESTTIKVEIMDLTKFKTTTTVDGQETEVPLVDKNSKIVVKYAATLDVDAVIGLDGNVNAVDLDYSNNPNQTGDGSEKPETGKTPKDKVIVFTYALDNTKVDTNGNKLQGAEFTLQNADNEYVIIDANNKVIGWTENAPLADGATAEEGKTYGSKLTSDEDGLFHVIGLDDATYTVTEIKAPGSYNELKGPVTMKISATTPNGQTWNDFVATNALTALDLTVTPTTGDKALKDTSSSYYDVENSNFKTSDGYVAAQIVNTSGAILPSTGGIGTTLFYVGGGVLVVGAGVLLITKKRVKKDAE